MAVWLEHFHDKWAKPGKNDTINLETKYWQNLQDDQIFISKPFFLIRIRSQSHRLIRKCLLQIIVGPALCWLGLEYLMFTLVKVKACLMQTQSRQPSHIYSCHFIWGVLFTFWAVFCLTSFYIIVFLALAKYPIQ